LIAPSLPIPAYSPVPEAVLSGRDASPPFAFADRRIGSKR